MKEKSLKEKLLGALPLLSILGGLASFIECIFKKDVEEKKTERALEKYFKKHPEAITKVIESQNNEEG